ncbi:helix-turn-helix domain-containing protein [Sphingomonas floccifaciens]|uniref:Helix-turn-helix domain-containing protein n=1 Tax=Sphingomonas floccifaciens TaxID=1844115 RepID=A0ABW4NEB6_9SPHN|nr:XRE family transcriptional regulator [Roseomonas aeriglobus]
MAIEHVTSSGNVFADLGLSDPEGRLVKSKLAAALQRRIGELGLTQTAASARMGMPQPKLSKILRGRFDGISEAYIADGLRKLGHDVKIRVRPRHEGIGAVRVLETA